MHTIKRLKNKSITTLLLSILIAVSLVLGAAIAAIRPARADEVEDTKEFEPTSLSISNQQFSSSSGSYPAAPSSWTGEYVDGGNGHVVKGVVDLTPSVYSTGGNKEYLLDQYAEYTKETDIPKSIFGEDTEFGGDKKTLLINTAKGAQVAYAYKSEEMTLSANSFYRFSVYVKTGKFDSQTGATVKLTGLGQYFAFNNIDTVKNNYNDNNELVIDETNDYGWVKYSLYVRTSASLSKTVRLSLGLGEGDLGGDEDPGISARPASGYVFFDDVKAERISAFDFAAETLDFKKLAGTDNVYGSGTSMAIDLNETKSLTDANGVEIGTFSQNVELWDKTVAYDPYDEDATFAGTAHKDIYNSEAIIKDLDSAANVYGFSQNPWAPYGKAEGKEFLTKDSPFFAGARNSNILLISTYDGNEFTKAAAGVASPFVTIERFKYYRFSVWVKGDNVQDGNGISIRVKGKLITDGTPAQKATLLKEYTNLDGDSSDKAHYGWKEQVVYIHGSMLYNYDVSFELWLGAPDAQSSGIAMFDNVTLTELKYSDYTAMSEADGGNVYTIDDTENSTNIVNGNFVNVGDMDEIKFPMPVADWTYLTPDGVGTNGFSKAEVNTDNAVHGIIPTDEATFNSIVKSGALPYAVRPRANNQNVLLLSSSAKTAFCYQSPSITLATDTANKLTVDMMVGGVDGYGASLVLKTTDGSVVSTIENIKNTNGDFRTYTFYLAAPLSEQTVYLEIWLGLNDRTDNKQKLSSGYVYVKQAALNAWTAEDDGNVADEFNAKLEEYKAAIATTTNLNYGIYSFAAPSLNYYDIYSYAQNDGLGIPYQWNMTSANANVTYGMFNTDNRKGLEIYPGFKTDGLSGNMLYVYNTDKNSTKYTYDNSLSLVANKYYRVDVKIKVSVTDEVRKDKTSVGAGIALTGSSAEFKNIKDTTTLVDVKNENSRDYETFKTYSFYISTGDNGGSIGLEITFGGEDKESYIQGRLIVGGVEMTEIDNLDYETAQKSKDKSVIAVELSESNTDNDNSDNTEAPSSEIQWWIIPTIIFSVLLVAAVILILVVRIVDHFKKKRKVTYSTEYDRSDVMNDIERLREQAENKNTVKTTKADTTDDLYEEAPVPQPENGNEQAEDETETEADGADKQKATEQPTAEQKPEKAKNPEDLDD
ncbi:MAG: hypothetical protein K2F90_00980 [Clostridiales bacterium]|nr:hypothetical protein [Clostridiales bacterium]